MTVLTNQDGAQTEATKPVRTSLAERVESVKAGIMGALAIGIAFVALVLVNSWLLVPQFKALAELQGLPDALSLAVSTGVAILSGFLFGVTYRYIIRQDNNPHLKSGAVLAFGLVRGLAQVDMGFHLQGTLLPFVVLIGESLLLFAIARSALDITLDKGWVKPFKSN